jgi:hypothetical protein
MDVEFGKRDDAVALPLSIMLIDQGKCPDCDNQHYTLDITVAMFFVAIHFNHGGGLNEDRV